MEKQFTSPYKEIAVSFDSKKPRMLNRLNKFQFSIQVMLLLTIVSAFFSFAFRFYCDSEARLADRSARHFFIEYTVGVVEKSEIDDAWKFSTAKDAKYGEGTLIYIEESTSARNGRGGRHFFCGIQLPGVVKQGDIFYLKSASKSEGADGTLRAMSPREAVVFMSRYTSPAMLSSEDNVEHGSITILSLTKRQVEIRFDAKFKMIKNETLSFNTTISLERVYDFSPMESLKLRRNTGSFLMFD
jgi:hypothetical protein